MRTRSSHSCSWKSTRATSWPRRTSAPQCSSLSLLALLWIVTSTKSDCASITRLSPWAPPYARPFARSATRRRCSCSFRRANDYHWREIKQFLNVRIFTCELYFIKSTAMTNNNNTFFHSSLEDWELNTLFIYLFCFDQFFFSERSFNQDFSYFF